jgi:hypothetical protein
MPSELHRHISFMCCSGDLEPSSEHRRLSVSPVVSIEKTEAVKLYGTVHERSTSGPDRAARARIL